MTGDLSWKGRPIDELSRAELVQALKSAVLLLRSVSPNTFVRPELEVTETPVRTLVAYTFNWAFIPAGHIWSDEDRYSMQTRLDDIAPLLGAEGAVVRFGPDRLEIDVPRRLQIEQIFALQEWLASEKESLDVSQVP